MEKKMQPEAKKYQATIGNRPILIETGKLAARPRRCHRPYRR
jgi:hypothetical protein